jgi:AraC-like DNA-binding protein
MSVVTANQQRLACRLKTVRVTGAHGAFNLTQIEHDARRFAPHFYATCAIGVVESGTCCIMTPRGSWTATPGSLVAFAPRTLHWAQVISDQPYAYRMAYLPAECLRTVGLKALANDTPDTPQLLTVTEPSVLSAQFLQSHRHVSDDPGSAQAAFELMACTRALLRSVAGPTPHVAQTRELTLVEMAKAVLTNHIGRRVALDTVADACGVTVFRLIRVFRRVTGLSPYSYLIVLRVNEARRLLDAGASVSDATYACCFSDQSHLTRIFKRTLGMPPGLYLRATR